MSVAIATMGKYCNSSQFGSEDGGSTPYAYGGGVIPGTLPELKRLKVNVSFLEVNKNIHEQKLEISPIKVIL